MRDASAQTMVGEFFPGVSYAVLFFAFLRKMRGIIKGIPITIRILVSKKLLRKCDATTYREQKQETKTPVNHQTSSIHKPPE